MKGIGVDIVSIERIRSSIDKYGEHFLQRIFTKEEIVYCKKAKKNCYGRFAARFAAKEAIAKAIGTGIGKHISWHDLEIEPNSLGKPLVKLSERAKSLIGGGTILLSISHEKEHAIAFASWI